MNYPQALAWLYSTQSTGIKLGLENIRRLLERLEIFPLPGAPCILHVAGTNGKGSVCAMLDAICRAAGLRTGCYTSPHLVTYRERITLDGVMIPEEAVAAGLTRLRDLTASWAEGKNGEAPPTFFELTTALALDWFARQNARVIILETGLGGRLDSTNVVTPSVSVLTPISLDHSQYLGNTLESIAAEKAGIIKRRVPVVSAPQAEEAARVIAATATQLGAPLRWIDEPVSCEVALPGSHQPLNAALAIATLHAAGLPVSETAIERGLREVRWPGRFQRCSLPSGTPLILDGAHNEAAADRLVQTWREMYGETKAVLILGVLADKDFSTICRKLAPMASEVIVTPVSNPRTCTADTLVRTLGECAPTLPCTPTASVQDALKTGEQKAAASGSPLLVTGSLFLIGETLGLLDGRGMEFASVQ